MDEEEHAHTPVPCQITDLAEYRAREDATPEELEKSLELVAQMNGYLSNFAKPIVDDGRTLCFHCGEVLYGSLIDQVLSRGGFRWGLVHGEGNCARCGWPARGHHRPKKEDGTGLFVIENFPLQYLPIHVQREDEDEGDH